MAQYPSDDPWVAGARRVLGADTDDFVSLVKLSGLDPKRHLRFANWSDISFRGCDLRGFDFTGARLIGCDFTNALIEGARFDQAEIDHVARNPGAVLSARLSAAADWADYAARWTRSTHVPADDHLPAGAVFQDAPLAPEMVVVQPGVLVASEHAVEREPVTIERQVAIGRHLVTFKEWQAAFSLGGVAHYGADFGTYPPDRGGWPTPVTEVSWEDAKGYAAWLTRITGKPYRLLNEAEYRYCDARSDIHRSEGATSLGIYFDRVGEWCEDISLSESNAPHGDGPRPPETHSSVCVTRRARFFLFQQSFDEYGTDSDTPERNDRTGFRVARSLVY